MDAPAIRTVDLGRTYSLHRKRPRRPDPDTVPSEFTALDNINLEIQPGELFGLLGSNGAGKTTLIKILTTLLAPTRGSASVDGLDVVSQAQAVRELINMVSGGETSGYGVLTVRENLWLFSQLYGVPGKEARCRIERLLAAVGLEERGDTRISHLSTGQRQKMNFCRGFERPSGQPGPVLSGEAGISQTLVPMDLPSWGRAGCPRGQLGRRALFGSTRATT
jgi:ABC-2 type transport system ATP-binding protein